MLPFFKTHGVSLDVFMFLSFLSLDADVTNPSALSHTPRSPNLSTVLNLALSAGSWRWMSCMTGARFGKITAIPTGWIYNILYICTHTCIASYCSSSNNNNNNNNSSNVTLFSRVWWLYPYRWKSKSFSHQFQSYLICLKTTLVLRDKNIPNAPKFEPFSWKNIYIYKASCQVRIENGFKTPTINPLVETEPGLLVPPHPHPCHLPPVLGWKNAFLSALPWLQWSLELPGGVISMEF